MVHFNIFPLQNSDESKQINPGQSSKNVTYTTDGLLDVTAKKKLMLTEKSN